MLGPADGVRKLSTENSSKACPSLVIQATRWDDIEPKTQCWIISLKCPTVHLVATLLGMPSYYQVGPSIASRTVSREHEFWIEEPPYVAPTVTSWSKGLLSILMLCLHAAHIHLWTHDLLFGIAVESTYWVVHEIQYNRIEFLLWLFIEPRKSVLRALQLSKHMQNASNL